MISVAQKEIVDGEKNLEILEPNSLILLPKDSLGKFKNV